ncbi:MAG: 50S ribosomal protein L20 [Chloroflexi bacterium]|jgi:large subunit ribosomal protein L20|nr:50S ribosomal protein L20 [Chloroflexota bacterium]
MARVRGGPHGYRKHKKILKLNKGYYGTKSKLFRRANEQYLKSQWYAYRDRRTRKRDLRKLWITRINAAARQNGTTYSKLLHGLRQTEINLNRKMLADLAVREPAIFSEIVKKALSG